MIRARRIWVTALAVLTVAGASPGWAQARQASDLPPLAKSADGGDSLPADWSITGEGAARKLVWRSDERVPMGDARVEFYAGDRLLGRPAPAKDGRTFRLGLDGVPLDSPQDLQVRAAGRRLDVPEPASGGGRAPGAGAPRRPAPPGGPRHPGAERARR